MPLLQRCANDVSLADVVVQLRRQVDILTQYLADLQPVASDTDSNVDDSDHRFVLSSPYTYDADHENDEFHDELSPCIPVDILPVFDEYPVELDGDDEYYSFLPKYDDESVSYEDRIKLDGVDDTSYSSPPVYDEESIFFEGSFELGDKEATIDSCLQSMVMETYYRKRSKKAHQPSMEMDQCHQKGAVQGSVAASESLDSHLHPDNVQRSWAEKAIS